MGDRRHGVSASPPRANATIEVSRSDVEVETPLDGRSFVRASVDRATRSLARRQPTRHPSIHPCMHAFVARAGADALEGGHRRVMIGDSSKPYVSRMTTVVDIRNSDVIDRSSHRSPIDRSSHRSPIDRSFSSIITSIASIVFIDHHIDRSIVFIDHIDNIDRIT